MEVQRREFLAGLSAGMGGLALPTWLAEGAAAQDPVGPRAGADRGSLLRKAARRAMGRGKPLLILVIPADKNLQYQRGKRLGALLNHGGRETLLDLALCELVCAPVALLPKHLGVTHKGADPTLLLVEFGKGRPRLQPLVVPYLPLKFTGRPSSQKERAERQEKQIRLDLQRLHAALHKALAADPGAVAHRADQVRGKLAADERELFESFVAGGGKLDEGQTLHFAALIRMAALGEKDPARRKRLLDRLVAAARQQILKQAVPGSRWARSNGCGMSIEGEEHVGALCGMGFVPPLARRFLHLYPE